MLISVPMCPDYRNNEIPSGEGTPYYITLNITIKLKFTNKICLLVSLFVSLEYILQFY